MHYYKICFLPISFKLFQNVLTWKENKQTFLIIIIILRDVFFEEIYTDSFLVIPRKNALAVALNHAWFSDGSIANDYHLQRKEKTIKVERYVRNPQYSILKYRDVVHTYIYIYILFSTRIEVTFLTWSKVNWLTICPHANDSTNATTTTEQPPWLLSAKFWSIWSDQWSLCWSKNYWS